MAEIGPWLAKTYGTLASVITAYGAYPAGLPFAGTSGSPSRPDFPVSTAIDAGGGAALAAARGRSPSPSTSVPTSRWPPRTRRSPPVSAAAAAKPAGDLWEVYFSDPASEPDPATWRTEIVQPYRPV